MRLHLLAPAIALLLVPISAQAGTVPEAWAQEELCVDAVVLVCQDYELCRTEGVCWRVTGPLVCFGFDGAAACTGAQGTCVYVLYSQPSSCVDPDMCADGSCTCVEAPGCLAYDLVETLCIDVLGVCRGTGTETVCVMFNSAPWCTGVDGDVACVANECVQAGEGDVCHFFRTSTSRICASDVVRLVVCELPQGCVAVDGTCLTRGGAPVACVVDESRP
ncbi:MAG TPA: hypothetical protein VHH36_09310 [Candidatus Thermoplasmatota archaeon]|nr:hypothetical protein [Candidatus Thermoplasmatota archaeon]